MPGVGHVAEDRGGADHVRAGPLLAFGEHVLDGASGADHLLERGLYAERPQLADVLLRRAAGVVCDKRHVLSGRPQLGDGLRCSGREGVADPDATVEVEQNVVVLREKRGERHEARSHLIMAAGAAQAGWSG